MARRAFVIAAVVVFIVLGWGVFAGDSSFAVAPSQQDGKVYVVLWFDYEDYIQPRSDDAALRIAEMLNDYGIRATFKIVGKKLEDLLHAGRKDIIDALARHSVGYHSYDHSVHPTIAEYLKRMGWNSGGKEFERRETGGVDLIKEVFGITPSCYGQPGSAWAPQTYIAFNRWGIRVYLDEGNHVGVDNQPFWYCGLLNMYKMRSNLVRIYPSPDKAELQKDKERFTSIYNRLRRSGGGVVSTYSHPCEFVCQESWDKINYRDGKNTAPNQWIIPRLRPQGEIEEIFHNFAEYIEYIRSHQNVEFITADELLSLYKDKAREKTFTLPEIRQIAREVQGEISFQVVNRASVSAAESLSLLASWLVDHADEGELPTEAKIMEVNFGPAVKPVTTPPDATLLWKELIKACRWLVDYFHAAHQLPYRIEAGGMEIAPEDFLATLGRVTELALAGEAIPARIAISRGNFIVSRYVGETGLWGWSVFPENFDAPELVELAKLQSWTLKPALLAEQEMP
ncbi:MAG: polysaccharide deacetylase family protein [Acidobacteriota bacterium]